MVRGLFEGAQYNSEAGAKCADYSRARTKQGRGVIEEIRYVYLGTSCSQNTKMTRQLAVLTACCPGLLWCWCHRHLMEMLPGRPSML